jgi:hypothetical protein
LEPTAVAVIEAAPELLEALEAIRDCHLGDCPAAIEDIDQANNHVMRLRKMASAAIAKAGGQQ